MLEALMGTDGCFDSFAMGIVSITLRCTIPPQTQTSKLKASRTKIAPVNSS
jgi:hypothetical protein